MELLVVIAIMALLLAVLMPSLRKARLQAKVLTVNAELHNIGLALEAYGMDNGNKFPPTRADCAPDVAGHWCALPRELANSRYLPGGKISRSKQIVFSDVEDKFNKGFAYKYIAPGPLIFYDGAVETQSLEVPAGFPEKEGKCISYNDPKISPVTWVIFSLGPKYDENNKSQEGFPVSRKFWYDPKTGSGLITRVRLKDKVQHIGTFQNNR